MTPGWLYRLKDYNEQAAREDSSVLSSQGLMFTVLPADIVANKPRAEFSCKLVDNTGSERAYESVITIPSWWENTTDEIIVMQWHGPNDATSTPVPLSIKVVNDNWRLVWQDPDDLYDHGVGKQKVLWVAPYENKPTRFRLEVKWHHNANSYQRLYVDDELVYEGKNKVNVPVYFKFGIYSPQMTEGMLQIFHNDTARFT